MKDTHFNESAARWDTPEKIESTRRYAEAIKARIPTHLGTRVLDFGCGTGLLSFQFADRAKSIVGMDTSEGMLAVFEHKAKQVPGARALNLDLENQNLPATEKFDLVISSMAFHHLVDPAVILAKMKNALLPGGRIAILDLDKEDGTFHSDPKKMGVHHFGFSPANIQDWARRSELKLLGRDIVYTVEKNGKSYPIFLAVFADG